MVQKREIVLSIILCIVTCGIYSIYWYYTLARDVNIVTRTEHETSAGLVLLLTIVTCGLYGFYWAYHAGDRLSQRKNELGIPSGSSEAVLYLILYFVAGIGAYALIQNDINLIVDSGNY